MLLFVIHKYPVQIGEKFEGVISGVTSWGIFVEITENKCEGMIPLKELDDDFYEFDEKKYCVTGRNTKKKYQLGDSVKIEVLNVNITKRQVDFTLVHCSLSF